MSNREKWIPLSEVQMVSQREFGDHIIGSERLEPADYCTLKQLQREYPLLISGFRFPYNPNNSEPLIDLDRIQVNKKLLHATNAIGMFRGQVMSEFYGEGSEYKETFYEDDSQDDIMAASSAQSYRIQPPESSEGALMFSPALPSNLIVTGFGKPIAINQLNRTAINERIDELEYPGSGITNDRAWAMTLDEQLRESIKLRSRGLSSIGSTFLSVAELIAFANTLVGDLQKKLGVAAVYTAGYILNLYAMNKIAKSVYKATDKADIANAHRYGAMKLEGIPEDEIPECPPITPYFRDALSPREWRMSLFSPYAKHLDTHLAAMAIMNSGELIRYQE